MALSTENVDPDSIKGCCTTFYENELVAKFFDDNFHPGGEKLTLLLGEQLGLTKDKTVLDVACGTGTSALALAKRFDCRVIGIDLSEKNLEKARAKVAEKDMEDKIEFKLSDAELLKFENEIFDSVICECALCTFPNKTIAIQEMYRVLKPGGTIGITDVVIEGDLPEELRGMISHVLCIAGAMSIDGYLNLLGKAHFKENIHLDQSHSIRELMNKVDKLLLGWDIIGKIFDCDLEKIFGITQEEAKAMLASGIKELESGNVGYGLFKGLK